MSESKKKTFVRGNAKAFTFSNGGTKIGISLNVKDFLSGDRGVNIEQMADNDGWVQLEIMPKRDGKDKFGNTHSIAIDDWKPDPKLKKNNSNEPDEDEAPF